MSSEEPLNQPYTGIHRYQTVADTVTLCYTTVPNPTPTAPEQVSSLTVGTKSQVFRYSHTFTVPTGVLRLEPKVGPGPAKI